MHIALSANSELIALYYELGARISERESSAQWGSGFIDAFSKDLKAEFPDVGGFSAKNLRYCRAFFRFYCDPAIWQQAVAKLAAEPWVGVEAGLAQRIAQVPWGHHIQIVSKCSGVTEASFYIMQTIEQGWSRDVLALQLKSKLHDRAGKAVTNFASTLTAPQSDLAQQTLKDPYGNRTCVRTRDLKLLRFNARYPVLLQTRHPRSVPGNQRGEDRFSGRVDGM